MKLSALFFLSLIVTTLAWLFVRAVARAVDASTPCGVAVARIELVAVGVLLVGVVALLVNAMVLL